MSNTSNTKAVPALIVNSADIEALNSSSVVRGTGERFTLNTENKTTDRQKVALLAAYFNPTADAANKRGDTFEINKNGFNVAAIAFDGEKTIGDGSVKFQSGNPSATIDAFTRYIRTNPRMLKSLLITTDNREAFDASIELTKANPMGNGKTISIDLNQYFSPTQYQDDRIIIDFSEQPLEITDDLVLCVNIPAGAKMGFNFRF